MKAKVANMLATNSDSAAAIIFLRYSWLRSKKKDVLLVSKTIKLLFLRNNRTVQAKLWEFYFIYLTFICLLKLEVLVLKFKAVSIPKSAVDKLYK